MPSYLIYDADTWEQIGLIRPTLPVLGPNEAAEVVPRSYWEGLTEWSPAMQGFADVPVAPPNQWTRPPYEVPFNSTGAGLVLNNQAAAAQFLNNTNRNIQIADLAWFTQARLTARVAVAGFAGSTLTALWAATPATAITGYADLGVTPLTVSMAAAGFASTGWVDINPGALGAERYLTIRMQGGNAAADPALGPVSVWLR